MYNSVNRNFKLFAFIVVVSEGELQRRPDTVTYANEHSKD